MAADELARGPKRTTSLAWDFRIVGGRAQYAECESAAVCTMRRRDVPAQNVLAMRAIGRAARPTGQSVAMHDASAATDEVDVVELTLSSGVETTRGGVAADRQRGLTISRPPAR